MKRALQYIKYIVRRIMVFPLEVLLERSQAKTTIEKDIHRWVVMNDRSRSGHSISEKLVWLLTADHMEEFRNLLYYRIGIPKSFLERFSLALSKALFKPLSMLSISSPSIGPGLVIKHGRGTVVDAGKIGENCLVFQDVVIGCKNEMGDRPTLGNYVHISAGAKVLGNITIGDHAVIAANSVVTKDLPPNSLALGIPARIIRNAGNKSEYIADGTIPSEEPS